MSIGTLIKRLQNIMRDDAGVNGDAQRIEQMVWIIFLKVYDAKEELWELHDDNYTSILPEKLRWRNWAVDKADGEAMTGETLLDFVNNELFGTIRKLEITSKTSMKKAIVKYALEDTNNYMKNGTLLRQVINVIDEIDFNSYEDKHAFNEIYETILKSLQSAGNAGEFYTPRAVTTFMAEMVKPSLDDKIADFACGTGGFLTSALGILEKQVKTTEDREKLVNSVYGIEKKQLPYILALTNMILHDVDNPQIYHMNTLEKDVKDYTKDDKFDVILMNPPYGGSELEIIKSNFPANLRSSETADLFMSVMMYRLKDNGRCAVVLPDGFLFGDEAVKVEIKKKLVEEFNLHTIIRLPKSVFAPYTSITTNILFFDKAKKNENIWYYRLDMPKGYKNFSKTKPILNEHFNCIKEWWNDRKEILVENDDYISKCYTSEDIILNKYNLDLCGYKTIEEEILTPDELLKDYNEKKEKINNNIDNVLKKIKDLLGEI